MMDIGSAAKEMKNGKCVRRSGWATGMYLYVEDQHSWILPQRNEVREYAAVVCIFSNGVHQRGWVCSQQDLLATDWEITEDPDKERK